MGYSKEEVSAIGNLGLGCGNPLAHVDLQPGEVRPAARLVAPAANGTRKPLVNNSR